MDYHSNMIQIKQRKSMNLKWFNFLTSSSIDGSLCNKKPRLCLTASSIWKFNTMILPGDWSPIEPGLCENLIKVFSSERSNFKSSFAL